MPEIPKGQDPKGVYGTLGWILTAEDMASDVATKAEKTVTAVADRMGKQFDVIATKTEEVAARAAEATSDISSGIEEVQPELRNLDVPLTPKVEEIIPDLEAVKDAVTPVEMKVTPDLEAVKDAVTPVEPEEIPVEPILPGTGMMVDRLAELIVEGLVKALDVLQEKIPEVIDGVKGIKKEMEGKTDSLISGAVFMKKMILGATKKVGEWVSKTFSYMSGMTRKIFGVFSPLVSLFKDLISPAMDVFRDLFSNVLDPIRAALEILVMRLFPVIEAILFPIVDMLSQVLLYVGQLVEMAFAGQDFGGLLKRLFDAAMPVIETALDILMRAIPLIMNLIDAALPVFVRLFETLMPPLVRLMEMFWGMIEAFVPFVLELVDLMLPMVMDLIDALIEVMSDLMPVILDAFRDLLPAIMQILKAVLPPLLRVVVPLIKLVGKLIEVLLPMLVVLVQQVAWLVEELIGPALDKISSALVAMMDFASEVADALEALFHIALRVFDGFWDKFRQLWEGVVDWFKGLWDDMIEFLGLDKIGAAITGLFKRTLDMLMTPIRWIAKFIDDFIVDTINFAIDKLNWVLDTFGAGQIEFMPQMSAAIPEAEAFAEGAALVQGTTFFAGERGPEMILPLEERAVEKVLSPILPRLTMSISELDITNGFLEEIRDTLQGDLSVRVRNLETVGEIGRGSDLDVAVGVGGL